jgi:branched-chain amino acid transport system permease protein
MATRASLIELLFLCAALILLPILQRPVIAAEILILGIAAVAANILIGYSGLLSFGQAMFFGVGAYIAGILVTRLDAGMAVAVGCAMAATAVLSFLIGWLCVRRSGPYFLMLTFAFNQMLYYIVYSLPTITGGEDGLPGVDRPSFLTRQIDFYLFVCAVFLLALGALRRIVASPAGRIWKAIRDNPARAAAAGYDIGRYRLAAFTISGTFTGLAGALFAFVFEFVPIDKIHWSFSGDIVFMTVVGGTGSFIGPALGAALYTWLQETVSVFWSRWPMAVGIAFLIVLRFGPGGIVSAVPALTGRLRSESDAIPAGSEKT